MSNFDHPEWVAVGKSVESVRRLGMSVAHRRVGTVTKHTATQVTVDYGGSVERFRPIGNQYHLVPKYLDYTTTIHTVGE